jgi:hypothetical protein
MKFNLLNPFFCVPPSISRMASSLDPFHFVWIFLRRRRSLRVPCPSDLGYVHLKNSNFLKKHASQIGASSFDFNLKFRNLIRKPFYLGTEANCTRATLKDLPNDPLCHQP